MRQGREPRSQFPLRHVTACQRAARRVPYVWWEVAVRLGCMAQLRQASSSMRGGTRVDDRQQTADEAAFGGSLAVFRVRVCVCAVQHEVCILASTRGAGMW